MSVNKIQSVLISRNLHLSRYHYHLPRQQQHLSSSAQAFYSPSLLPIILTTPSLKSSPCNPLLTSLQWYRPFHDSDLCRWPSIFNTFAKPSSINLKNKIGIATLELLGLAFASFALGILTSGPLGSILATIGPFPLKAVFSCPLQLYCTFPAYVYDFIPHKLTFTDIFYDCAPFFTPLWLEVSVFAQYTVCMCNVLFAWRTTIFGGRIRHTVRSSYPRRRVLTCQNSWMSSTRRLSLLLKIWTMILRFAPIAQENNSDTAKRARMMKTRRW